MCSGAAYVDVSDQLGRQDLNPTMAHQERGVGIAALCWTAGVTIETKKQGRGNLASTFWFSLNTARSPLVSFVIVAYPAMYLQLLHLCVGQALSVTHHHVPLDVAHTAHTGNHG